MAEEPSSAPSARTAENYPSAAVERWQRWLPPVLAVIAGMSDVIGYLDFKVFTAHITGNIVLIAAYLVLGRPPELAEVLSVPVYALAVAAIWLIARGYRKKGRTLARLLLLVQLGLLAVALFLGVAFSTTATSGVVTTVIPMVVVCAIACQFALLRLTLPGAPSTAVMTGNTTNLVLSLLDTVSQGEPLVKGARENLKKTAGALIGFFLGCIAGAAAVAWIGGWAWSFPVMVALLAVVLG
jgi:uncharacterized membrane protein YoaK (UPF0700 family)